MGWAIICNSRKGKCLGIKTLALVDRRITRNTWWTSDNSSLIMDFDTKAKADLACLKLKKNNARVVTYEGACSTINTQNRSIIAVQKQMDHDDALEGDGMDYLCERG